MSQVTNLFYPAGAELLGTYLGQSSDQGVANNLEALTAYGSGDYAPSFQGSKKNEPEFSIDSTNLAGALDLCTDDALARDLSGGDARLLFRQVKQRGTRHAANTTKHMVFSMLNNAMLYWNQIQASQDDDAKISVRVVGVNDGTQSPLTQLPDKTITDPPLVTRLYTLGEVVIDGTKLNGLQSCNWQNQVEVDKVASNGAGVASLATIKSINPQVSCDVLDMKQAAAFGSEGFALTTLAVYFRRRKKAKINYPDGDAVHLKLAATAGTVKFVKGSGEKGMSGLEIHLERPSAGTPVFTYTKDVAIP